MNGGSYRMTKKPRKPRAPQNLAELVAQQAVAVEALMKRLSGLDAMLAQGQQERNQLVADVIMAKGKLEGIKAAQELTKGASNGRTRESQEEGLPSNPEGGEKARVREDKPSS